MKILFHLAHPAQYHMFKFLIRNLNQRGHHIKITINTKDILEQLLIADSIQYENILPARRKGNSKFATLFTLIKKDLKIFRIQLKGNYDLFVGTESALSHIGFLFRKPVLIMAEDDAHVIPEAAAISFPFATYIVSPVTCNLGRWSGKKIAYNGFQKTAYLHPDYFTADEEVILKAMGKREKFYFIRISGLSAYHDKGIRGFSVEIIRKIVEILSPTGKVLLSTERELPEDLQRYLLKTEVKNIHHFLSFAEFLIADSQSMCVEAALLGTPSVRFSDFAGKIGVLEELEYKYGLTFGVGTAEQEKLFTIIGTLLDTVNLRKIWEEKRNNMLEEKIDVTEFWTWLIDSFPGSIDVLNNNPGFQNTFTDSSKNR